jgi:lactoylglutathione lyase
MRALAALFVTALAAASAADLKLTGITHVAVRVSDLAKSRAFYHGVLGYEEPFQFTDKDGRVSVAFVKVNDRQYIELYPGLAAGSEARFMHVCFETPDMQATYAALSAAGLEPRPMKKAGAGNLLTVVKDPDGAVVEFLEYAPGSRHLNAAGQALGAGRISTRMLHAGVLATEEARSMKFYRDQLGLTETWRWGPEPGKTRWVNLRVPGERGDYIELMLGSAASLYHICLEVPDIQAAWKTLRARAVADEEKHRPRVGRNGRWQLNLWDPDGTRVELMEPKAR